MSDYQKAMRDREEVHRRLGYLDEQKKLAEAITYILRSGYRDQDTSSRCHIVERHLFRVMIQNVERIWVLSGGELTDEHGDGVPGREVRGDDLPF